MANLDVTKESFQGVHIHDVPIQEIANSAGTAAFEIEDMNQQLSQECNASGIKGCPELTPRQFKQMLRVIRKNVRRDNTWFNIPNVFTPKKYDELVPRINLDDGAQLGYSRFFTDTIEVWNEPPQTVTFVGQGVEFSSDFLGARMSHVTETDLGKFKVHTTPEASSPINASPWYAFEVKAVPDRDGEFKERTIQITIIADGYTQGDVTLADGSVSRNVSQPVGFRYYPKISTDGGETWQPLPADQIEFAPVDPDLISEIPVIPHATITLTVGDEPVLISAQELHNSEKIKEWTLKMSELPYVESSVIGFTREDKEIYMLNAVEGSPENPYIIIMGGLHPPEATGRWAQQTFVETLLGNSEQAKLFRQHYNIAVIPAINLDGIDNGHWRFSSGGVDLNRDWKTFEQPETRAVRDALLPLQENGVDFSIDFHSTLYDTMYLADNTPEGVSDLDRLWLDHIIASRKERGLIADDDPDNPDQKKGTVVSKAIPYDSVPVSRYWLIETFLSPAVTYEVGDETPRDILRESARVEAEILMKLLTDQFEEQNEEQNEGQDL
jgi:cytosolic carboxypeptidase protein 6